ncbi:SDR family oxidoreductase [Candidatus Pelagibacter sp.]|jgi:dTDP-4-dehydrorhamnose reductase|nr:SDR family oxidoreductase [Candidatus Pelagibacter sp.]
MKIYILGISGMLGSKLFTEFLKTKHQVRGSLRRIPKKLIQYKSKIDADLDVYNLIKLKKKILRFKPDIIINCVGVIKQKIFKLDEKDIFYVNSVFPHEACKISKISRSKFIHFSTDCVFDGKKGNYKDNDEKNAKDIYGISKSLGELNENNSITLRTSIIGHELNSKNSLLDWFLGQNKKQCHGYSNAFFSGLPTIEIFNFIEKFIIKNKKITGIYNLSSTKISKYYLLKIISKIYSKKIMIIKSNNLKIDRSLNSNKIKNLLNYKCPSWTKLIKNMYLNHTESL